MNEMTNEVLAERILGVDTLVNEKFNENEKQHLSIMTQVTKTNGRVRLLEKFIWGMGGAIAVLAFILTISLPTILKLMF